MINIDGSQGEGGGQILRTALGLSLCTGQAFRITQIRAGRRKPGLLRQHLTAVQAAEQVGNATVTGAELGSCELIFRPGSVKPGKYQFAVGTAGSATLVFQTVLPALMMAGAESNLECQGGTHNPFAPPFDFLDLAFASQLRKMGFRLELTLNRAGFFPAGGGSFHAKIETAEQLKPIRLIDKGALLKQQATIYLANLPAGIAEREKTELKKLLSWAETCFEIKMISDQSGPGNVLLLEESHENVTEIITSFGEKGIGAEQVVRDAVQALRRHQFSNAVVGEYLADQLLVPMALVGAGEFLLGTPSSHAITNAETLSKFLEKKVIFQDEGEGSWRCTVAS